MNCAGADGTDIHISIGPKSVHFTEYDGIVVVGSLTYDNEHFVNDNPASPKSSQPKRFSLWEIHPITAFYVCPAGDGCDSTQVTQWVALENWVKTHP